ncbi:hypothetical protein [Gordonia sp. (in: high G+C Gram-positive bacteria)]
MYIRRNTQATLTKPTAPGRPTPRVAPLAFLATPRRVWRRWR